MPARVSRDSHTERQSKVGIKVKGAQYFLTSQKTEIAKYASEPKLRGLFAEDALAKQYFDGDFITADHKDLNEECESRNNHRYAVVVEDLATQ